jgi:hypothetical protein
MQYIRKRVLYYSHQIVLHYVTFQVLTAASNEVQSLLGYTAV